MERSAAVFHLSKPNVQRATPSSGKTPFNATDERTERQTDRPIMVGWTLGRFQSAANHAPFRRGNGAEDQRSF